MNYGNVKNLSVRIVCGFYDDSKYVQPACEIKQSGEIDDEGYVGLINNIPAGKTYLTDGSWTELDLFDSWGDVCRESDITEEIFPENEK